MLKVKRENYLPTGEKFQTSQGERVLYMFYAFDSEIGKELPLTEKEIASHKRITKQFINSQKKLKELYEGN